MKKTAMLAVLIAMLPSVTAAGPTGGSVDLPYRASLEERSRAQGLGTKSVQVLTRSEGRGRETVLADALARFAPSPSSSKAPERGVTVRVESDHSIATGEGWFLDVRGTGDWVRFRHYGYITGPQNFPLPPQARVPASELETSALRSVQQDLSSFVRLGLGEELRGYTLSHLTRVATDASGQVTRSVHASSVTLIRLIDGIPVLGPGSKVTIILANDGTLVGFDIDWAEIKRHDRVVATADLPTLRARQNAILGLQEGMADPQDVSFACGYYDPGVTAVATGGLIEPACVSIVRAVPAADGSVLLKAIVPARSEG